MQWLPQIEQQIGASLRQLEMKFSWKKRHRAGFNDDADHVAEGASSPARTTWTHRRLIAND